MYSALRITVSVALSALLSSSTFGQSARLQIIHNCADLNASVVDIYLNGALTVPDLGFRTATPFIHVMTGVPLQLAIAPGNSGSVADALFTQTVMPANGETYIAVASGTFLKGGYAPNAPFSFEFLPGAREVALESGVDVLLMQGSTDAPILDIDETAGPYSGVANDLDYGAFSDYLNMPSLDHSLQLRTTDNQILAAYRVPLETLNLQGAAITVLASGFRAPDANSNGPAFGLWMATGTGGPLTRLLPEEVPALIDNSEALLIYPNPTRALATLQMEVDKAVAANVDVSDISGRTLRSIASVQFIAGMNRVMLDLSDLPSGLYTVRVRGEGLARHTSIMLTP